MADIVDALTRRRMMSGIKGKNTKPELIIRRLLFSMGYRFRLHQKDLAGTPDIVFRSKKIAIFVHGCFWHRHTGCRLAKLPKTNSQFWEEKLNGNVCRDKLAVAHLKGAGWRILTIWECSVKRGVTEEVKSSLSSWLNGGEVVSEIPACPILDGKEEGLAERFL